MCCAAHQYNVYRKRFRFNKRRGNTCDKQNLWNIYISKYLAYGFYPTRRVFSMPSPKLEDKKNTSCCVKIINHRKTLEILFLHFCHSLQCLLILQIWNKILRYLQWQWMLGKFIWWNKNSIISSTLNIHKLVFMQLYKSSQNQIAVYI